MWVTGFINFKQLLPLHRLCNQTRCKHGCAMWGVIQLCWIMSGDGVLVCCRWYSFGDVMCLSWHVLNIVINQTQQHMATVCWYLVVCCRFVVVSEYAPFVIHNQHCCLLCVAYKAGVYSSQTTCRANASPKGKAKAKAVAKKATVKPLKLTKHKCKVALFAVNVCTIQSANNLVCCMLLVHIFMFVSVCCCSNPSKPIQQVCHREAQQDWWTAEPLREGCHCNEGHTQTSSPAEGLQTIDPAEGLSTKSPPCIRAPKQRPCRRVSQQAQHLCPGCWQGWQRWQG